jgi:hypothetical protein
VLGERNPRQVRDLFPSGEAAGERARQVVLWADTAYELLRVILVEHQCCVAISDRVPPERTPQPFIGPQGELLLYTPPPVDWRYDALDLEAASEDEAPDESGQTGEENSDTLEQDQAASETEESADAESEARDPADLAAQQQERLWDGALPLNAVQVGDEVVLAQPYRPGAWADALAGKASAPTEGGPAAAPAAYDWLKL